MSAGLLLRLRSPRCAVYLVRTRASLARNTRFCTRHSQPSIRTLCSTVPRGVVSKIIDGARKNISGYTRVLIVIMGIMAVVIIVAEQSIAQNRIIVNVLPQKPNHNVFLYPHSVFGSLTKEKQLIQTKTVLLNIHGRKGCGKTEFLRQYCEYFLEEGPHLYFKLHKLSNRQKCQVFVLDSRNSQTLAHSLTALNNKLRQTKGTDGATENHNLIDGIKEGLKKQSRWLLVFENASDDLDLTDVLSGYEDWGDGQIIVTSDEPLSSVKRVPFSSLIPRATAEKVYFSIAPPDETFDLERLHVTFGNDLRGVVTAASCVKLEQSNSLDFNLHKLLNLLSDSKDAVSDVVRLYCSLIALKTPKMMVALDFMGKLPHHTPIPYKYIKQHMDTNMYDSFLEVIPGYAEHRLSKLPRKEASPSEPEIAPEPTVDPSTLGYFGKQKYTLFLTLGLDPSRGLWDQLDEISEMIWPKEVTVPEDPEMALLRECCLLKYDPEYGGHVPVFNVDEDMHKILGSVHTDFTAPLLEAALVLHQDIRYNRTWISKMWSFRQAEQTAKHRADILGKGKVHPDPKFSDNPEAFSEIPPIYDTALAYRAGPISKENMAEYETLHYKQVLRTVMSFVDVTVPNTVKGTMESIILHGHLSALAETLPEMYNTLAETCSLHLKSELGGGDMESRFQESLEIAKTTDPKGPSHASALHRYSIWLHNNSRDAEAKVFLDEATKFADSITLNRTVASVCCELDDLETAEKYLEKAVNMVKPGDGEVLGPIITDLGQVLLLQGKTAMGIKYLQGAIEGFKNQMGTQSPEYARALNVVSIGHLMLGDTNRANRARNEASKVLSKLKKDHLIADD